MKATNNQDIVVDRRASSKIVRFAVSTFVIAKNATIAEIATHSKKIFLSTMYFLSNPRRRPSVTMTKIAPVADPIIFFL
jgi:hypothetical protein